MRDPHQNLFFYYRGPSKKGTYDAHDQQVENNTTKSLINTLEFLHDNNFDALQNAIFTHLKIRKESILFYKLEKKEEFSRPDVLIHLETYKIYIEVKVKSKLRLRQIRNHLKALETADYILVLTDTPDDSKKLQKHIADNRILFLTWLELHSICNQVITKFKCYKQYSVQLALLNQFTDYLEMVTMTDFFGFKNEDFDFFLDYNNAYKPILKGKLEKFAGEIIDNLPKKLRKYSDIKIGNIRDNPNLNEREAWVAIKKPKDKADILNQCNFTIQISSSELSVNAVIRNGRVTNKRGPAGLFYNVLSDYKKSLKVFKNIKSKTSFVIYKRLSRRGNGSPGRGDERWDRYFNIDVNCIRTFEDIKMIQNVLSKADFPGIHIRRAIPRGSKILSEPKKILKEVLNVLEELSTVLVLLESNL